MRKKNLKEIWTGRFVGGGAVTSVVSMMVTFQGLMQVSGRLGFCLPLTIATGVISYLVFAFLCQVLPETRAEDKSKLGVGVLIPGLMIVAATSTSLGVLGMAAPEAQRLEMLEMVEQADGRLEELIKRQKQQAEAVRGLEAKAKEFSDLAEEEKATGTYERRGPRGKAYRDLLAISEGFTAAADSLRQDQARREGAATTASESLATLRELAESTKASASSLRQVSEPYTQQLRTLNVALAELERSALEGDVLAPVRTILLQRQQAPLRGDREKRETQREATEAIAALAAQALEQAETALAELQYEPEEHERLTMPSPLQAVLEHLDSVIHLVAFPVALDLGMPLLALAALSLMPSAPEPKPQPAVHTEPIPMQEHPHDPSRPWTRLDQDVAESRIQRALGARPQRLSRVD